MAGKRFGGKYSPTGAPAGETPPPAFRNRRARRVSLRARSLFLLPLPLLFAGLGAIRRGDALEMVAELGGFAGLMLAAWLVNEGLRAEEAYDARTVARPPAIPRKLFGAGLVAVSVGGVSLLSHGQGPLNGLIFGLAAGVATIVAFGLDPMRKKGIDGLDDFSADRVTRAIEEAEQLVRDTAAAAARIGDQRLAGRVDRLCDQARGMFRMVERDPRDLARSRAFLSVYLLGLRDATVKFADLSALSRDSAARSQYEDLLGDLEASFSKQRTHLMEDNRGDLEVEIEVLRDRLRQDGLTPR